MKKASLFLLIVFFYSNLQAQGSKLVKQDCEKLINYFESHSEPVMYWNSCDNTWGKTLYHGLSFRSEQIGNSNLYYIFTSDDISAVPFDEKGYITDTMIEISAINVDYLFVYRNGTWINITSLIDLPLLPCITNMNLILPEFKSGRSLPFKDYGYISSSTSGNEFYIKVEERNSEFIELWLKVTDPVKRIKNKSGKWISKGGGYDLILVKIYCEQNYCDIEKKYKYSKEGKVLYKDNMQEMKQRIIPETSIDIARKYICEK